MEALSEEILTQAGILAATGWACVGLLALYIRKLVNRLFEVVETNTKALAVHNTHFERLLK